MKTRFCFFLLNTILWSFFSLSNAGAQCGGLVWQLSNDCGDIQASGGPAPNSPIIFCEGQDVVLENNSSPAAQITMTYVDWDDGLCEAFNGCPPSFSHAYDFPNDTCIGGSGQIDFNVRVGVEKICGNLRSFHFITFPIAVRFKPVAGLGVSPPVACVGNPVDFNNNSCENSNNPQYLWTINGQTFTTENVPDYIFNNPGTYNVTLAVTNTCGTDIAAANVVATPPATANATPSATQLCAPGVVSFTNQSTNAVGQTWMVMPGSGWNFTGGTNSSSPEPSILFSAPGTYTVTLKVSGCGNPQWMTTITVLAPPAVSIASIPDECTAGSATVTPTATLGGTMPTVSWQFPGGNPATGSGPNPGPVAYATQGTYIVSATATVAGCGSVTDMDTFIVAPQPTAAFALSDPDICGPNTIVTVTNNSTNAGSYTWTVAPATGFIFANGTTANSPEPQFQFTAEGVFTLTMTVNACNNPVATQMVNVQLTPAVAVLQIPEGCVDVTLNPLDFTQFSGGTAQTIAWTFGGGTPAGAMGNNPGPVNFTGFGQHFIAVTATNACGAASAVDSFLIFEPAGIMLTPVQPLCNTAAPIQLQATPVNPNGWSGPGVSPGGLFDPAQVPANLLNTDIPLIYQYGVGSCEVFDTLEILVWGTVVNAGPDQSLCSNAAAVTLSGSPAGGVWSGAGVTPGGVFDPVATGGGSFALSYTFMDTTTACANADAVVVTVLGPPTAALDSIGNVCVGMELDLGPFSGGSGVSSCQWDFGDGGTSSLCDTLYTYDTPGTYDLTLFVENTAGCRDTATVTLQVVTPPDAQFATDVTEGCADLPVTISNQSALNGYTLYIWDYGNGQQDTLTQPGTIIFEQGEHDTTYTITLSAVNLCGVATDQQPITVFPRPQVRFGTDISSGCTPLEVNFNNVSVGEPDFFQWYVNGVPVDTQFQLPQQVFFTGDQDSLYLITLIAGNECGFDTITHSVLVKPNPVEAFFNTDTLTGCQPFTVQLIDYSTQGLYLSWDLGDGNFATGDTVTHTFQAAGQYFVREFVNNGCGFDTAGATITVLPAPTVSFLHAPFVCQGDTLFFQNTSPNLAGSFWDFGDGTGDSTQTSPAHVFGQAGSYTVTLTGLAVTTGCRASASSTVEVKSLPQPAVVLPDSFGCQPFAFQPQNNTTGTNFYVWDFGNGATSTEAQPVYLYQQPGVFTVGLSVTDLFGCRGAWTYAPLNVYPKPTAQFDYDQAQLCVTPALIQFQNQSVGADTYDWDFGPPGNSDLQNPSLTVDNPGTLQVSLIVESQFHCRDTAAREVKVYTAPALDFAAEPADGCEPLPVLFENFSAAVNQYAWHFGDGTMSLETSPLHIYEHAGQYSVTLYAAADSLCFDSLTFTNLVVVLPSPTADFAYEAWNDTTVHPNGIIRFFDASVNALRWHWDFGDGDTSALQNPVHRYTENGPRAVTLIVFNDSGCPDTTVQTITPEPFGGLFIPNALSPEAGEPGARAFLPVGVGLVEFEISVYASNGQRVWHSTHLDEGRPDESWDGTLDGKPLPQGLYWWKARARFYSGRLWTGMRYDGDAPVTEGKVLLIR